MQEQWQHEQQHEQRHEELQHKQPVLFQRLFLQWLARRILVGPVCLLIAHAMQVIQAQSQQ